MCRYCALNKRKQTKVYKVNIPYATKQLIQELIAVHIMPKLYFVDKDTTF